MITQLTEAQAIEFHDSGAWERLPIAERAAFQLEQGRLCMPFSKFHEAIEHALGRPVWTHEFVFPDRLRDEMAGRAAAPSFDQILALLPAGKTVIVAAPAEGDAHHLPRHGGSSTAASSSPDPGDHHQGRSAVMNEFRRFFEGLRNHLTDYRHRIVRSETFDAGVYDPTYGLQQQTITIETMDFDALLNEIDSFAQTFFGE